MALFWLARSYFKNGNQRDAARTMSRFTKEYPDNPLKNTVEDDILALVARYEKGKGAADRDTGQGGCGGEAAAEGEG